MCGGAECECASGGEDGEDSPQHTEDGLEMEVVADEADAADGHVIARERGRGREVQIGAYCCYHLTIWSFENGSVRGVCCSEHSIVLLINHPSKRKNKKNSKEKKHYETRKKERRKEKTVKRNSSMDKMNRELQEKQSTFQIYK